MGGGWWECWRVGGRGEGMREDWVCVISDGRMILMSAALEVNTLPRSH